MRAAGSAAGSGQTGASAAARQAGRRQAGDTRPKPGAAAERPAASSEDSKISRIDAQGHVVVIGATDIGRGDYAVYNATTGICTLLGNVVITRGKDVITGQYAVMDMNRNISRILPASTLPGSTQERVQGVFAKQDLPGQGPAAAPPAPPKARPRPDSLRPDRPRRPRPEPAPGTPAERIHNAQRRRRASILDPGVDHPGGGRDDPAAPARR